ncbi:MAG: hypothetical protein WCQ20_09235 [Synechococcaceae cyanobacterium ELA739]
MRDGARYYPMAALIRLTLISLYLALVLPLPLLAPSPLRPWMALALVTGLGLIVAITSERVELDERGLRVGHPPWCAWWLRRGWSLDWPSITGLTPVATSQGGRVFYVRSQPLSAQPEPSGTDSSSPVPVPGEGGESNSAITTGLATGAQPATTHPSTLGAGLVAESGSGAQTSAGAGVVAPSGSSTRLRSGSGRSYLLPQRIAGFEDFLERFSAASGIDTRGVGRITPPWTYQLLALLSGLLLAGEVGLFLMGPTMPG